MQLFDAHTHIDMPQFDADLPEVIERARAAGLLGMVSSSTGPDSLRKTLGIAKDYREYIHHSTGCMVSRMTKPDADSLIALTSAHRSEVVAVGEVGLDYHWVQSPHEREEQAQLFKAFIQLSSELDLPLVVHSRKAEAEAVAILEHECSVPVLMHCFDGPPSVAERVRDNGWSISLPVTFRSYRNRVRAAQTVPLNQIMLETDGPFLSPSRMRNEPANLVLGCRALADLLGLPASDVAAATLRNARQFYRV